MRSFLYTYGKGAQLSEIHYFSALATHLVSNVPGPSKVDRHNDYIRALRSTGVLDHLGSFKRKPTLCKLCGGTFQKFEEKETDVAIAAKLFEVLATDTCDTAVLVTGDTDLVPAIKTARNLYPNKEVCVGFPYWRFNAALKQVAARHFIIKRPKTYAKHQLPNPVQLPDGTSVPKPAEW